MEENIIGEQPELTSDNVQEGIVKSEEEKGTALDEVSESSLGKFKDTNALIKAYNSLQAEFTKKCQKLSQITKELEENEAKCENSNKAEQKPVYACEDWKEKVSAFLEENSEARKYSGQIANEILNDKALQSSPNALALAWGKVMQKNFVEPEKLAHDENFINEKILTSELVKKKVLDEYFKNLTKQDIPTVIGASGNVASVAHNPPKTMQEAKMLVEKMFNT